MIQQRSYNGKKISTFFSCSNSRFCRNVRVLISPNWVSWRLLCNMKHDISSIILYVCLAISARSIWPLFSPDTQIPFLGPGAVFVGTITLFLFLWGTGWRWWAITDSSRFFCLIFNNWPCVCSVGPIVNSCKLTIWRGQLWVTTGVELKRKQHLQN